MSTANSRYNALIGSSSAPASTGGPLSMANLPTVAPQNYGGGSTPVSVPTYSIGPITDSYGSQTPSTPATGGSGGGSGSGGSGGGKGGNNNPLPGPTSPLSPQLAEAMLRNTAQRVSSSNVGPNPVSTLAAMEALMMRDNAIPNYTPMFGSAPAPAPVKRVGIPGGDGSIYSTGKNAFADGGVVDGGNPLQTAAVTPPPPPPGPTGYHGMHNVPRPPGGEDMEDRGRRDWRGDHSWGPRWGNSWGSGQFGQLQQNVGNAMNGMMSNLPPQLQSGIGMFSRPLSQIGSRIGSTLNSLPLPGRPPRLSDPLPPA